MMWFVDFSCSWENLSFITSCFICLKGEGLAVFTILCADTIFLYWPIQGCHQGYCISLIRCHSYFFAANFGVATV